MRESLRFTQTPINLFFFFFFLPCNIMSESDHEVRQRLKQSEEKLNSKQRKKEIESAEQVRTDVLSVAEI